MKPENIAQKTGKDEVTFKNKFKQVRKLKRNGHAKKKIHGRRKEKEPTRRGGWRIGNCHTSHTHCNRHQPELPGSQWIVCVGRCLYFLEDLFAIHFVIQNLTRNPLNSTPWTQPREHAKQVSESLVHPAWSDVVTNAEVEHTSRISQYRRLRSYIVRLLWRFTGVPSSKS